MRSMPASRSAMGASSSTRTSSPWSRPAVAALMAPGAPLPRPCDRPWDAVREPLAGNSVHPRDGHAVGGEVGHVALFEEDDAGRVGEHGGHVRGLDALDVVE